MSIVSSTYTLDGPVQINGNRYVRESHTDHLGVVHLVDYSAVAGTDYQAVANARASSIALQLAENEFLELVNG